MSFASVAPLTGSQAYMFNSVVVDCFCIALAMSAVVTWNISGQSARPHWFKCCSVTFRLYILWTLYCMLSIFPVMIIVGYQNLLVFLTL